jgi:dienelactone hydrolase
MKLQSIAYEHDGVSLNGLLALPANLKGNAPGVLVIHAADGISEGIKERVRMFAALGYVAFAPALFDGVHPRLAEAEIGAAVQPLFWDNALLRARSNTGLDILRARPEVAAERIAAVGYGLGGKAALELARSGADIAGTVSYHGLLATKDPARKGAVKARLLIFNGARDPFTPGVDIAAFQKEMVAAEANWQFVNYSHATHGFAILGKLPVEGPNHAYDASADRQSWAATQAFFAEIF